MSAEVESLTVADLGACMQEGTHVLSGCPLSPFLARSSRPQERGLRGRPRRREVAVGAKVNTSRGGCLVTRGIGVSEKTGGRLREVIVRDPKRTLRRHVWRRVGRQIGIVRCVRWRFEDIRGRGLRYCTWWVCEGFSTLGHGFGRIFRRCGNDRGGRSGKFRGRGR